MGGAARRPPLHLGPRNLASRVAKELCPDSATGRRDQLLSSVGAHPDRGPRAPANLGVWRAGLTAGEAGDPRGAAGDKMGLLIIIISVPPQKLHGAK